MNEIEIDNFVIKNKSGKAFIIAELSANHLGNYEIAEESVKAVKKIGANAVKLQTFLPETMTLKSYKDGFLKKEYQWCRFWVVY